MLRILPQTCLQRKLYLNPTQIYHMLLIIKFFYLQNFYNIFKMNYINWKVMIDIGFWSRLTKKKIEQYKLDSTPKPLYAKFRLSNKPDKYSSLSVDAYSFGDSIEEEKSGPIQYYVKGTFTNFNTVEEFQSLNIQDEEYKLMAQSTQKIRKWVSGEDVDFFSEINLLIFADLKKHLFKYLFLSPSIPVEDYSVIKFTSACQFFGQANKNQVVGKLNEFIRQYTCNLKKTLPQFFVLRNLKSSSIKQFLEEPEGDYLFCITDTTNYEKHTGYHTSTILSIFSFLREEGMINSERLLSVKILLMKEFLVYGLEKNYPFKISEIYELNLSAVKRAGNQKRISLLNNVLQLDLKSFMDERVLAKEAVDLNIRLMKWRLLPTLDIEKVQGKKCLLFGAGTLGCQLARNLIGWGIKNITFIDYSTVSYSNPVRQSLYEYEDTIKGGKPKAQTAAQKLMKIYPQIKAQGLKLRIPMPGHYVTKQEHIQQTFETLNKLQELVQEHDVLFLLLDSRQARWLPTVLANKYDKACITVGLGFDSFVIVRHGVSPSLFNPQIHKERICCYFCNDIITPQNTMKDRTLDQQCTVTRPGLSFLASAYASELYISLIHHPLQHKAPAHQDHQKLQTTDLGKLPHHIRGNMSDFETQLFYGRAFDKCVACSDYILKQYTNNRQQFMLKVLNDPSFIHEVVQLKDELKKFDEMGYNIIEILDDDFYQITEGQQTENTKEIEKKQSQKINQIQIQAQNIQVEVGGIEGAEGLGGQIGE